MKKSEFLRSLFLSLAIVSIVLVSLPLTVMAQDPGWPRQKTSKAGSIIYYQPQVDEWKDHKQLIFRTAFSLTPAGGKQVVGVAVINAKTDVNVDTRTVFVHDLEITETHFPSVEASAKPKLDELVRTFLPKDSSITVSLDRIVASVEKPAQVPTVTLKSDPPQIFVSNRAAILVHADGEPVMAKIKDTNLEFLINTNFPVFHDRDKKNYYVFTGKQWLTSTTLNGQWVRATTLPKDMNKVKKDPEWAGLAAAIPPPPTNEPAPTVFYATGPSEVILFTGTPVYSVIKGTNLVYASNTDSDVFVHTPSQTYYYLASGRWFRAKSLQGPWTYASADLPADFSKIPDGTPPARVLQYVPGTEAAKDAVMLAQVPTIATVDPVAAAAKASVTYNGSPEFKPIEGTSLYYAINTAEKVIRVGSSYYLCLNGVWFLSANPQGPWTTATSIPAEIYKIPPSSPVYNVTYVTQTTTSSGSVQSSYTAGYMGAFVVGMTVGAVLWCGTGYYYHPYYYYPAYGYPRYYGYPATYGYGAYYNHYSGAYGVARGVYGPYGGATGWASYNPYTGTYARGGSVYGPYGSASAGRAYNPYTGTSARAATVTTPYGSRTAAGAYNPYTGNAAATRQGSSPYGQWGTSVVSNGSQAIQTGHVSTSAGTVSGARTTSGGKAISSSGGYYGTGGTAVKTGSGDMYAAKDGTVYKNTGSGWQTNSGSGWSSVNTPTQQTRSTSANSANRQTMSSSTYNSLNSEMQNRQRGAAQTRNFQSSQRFGGARSGASRSGGGRRR